jgi:glycine hydroxymethyltransferase
MVTSGLRIGTPALATRGFQDSDFVEVADIIATALIAPIGDLEPAIRTALSARVTALAHAHPLYPGLGVVV